MYGKTGVEKCLSDHYAARIAMLKATQLPVSGRPSAKPPRSEQTRAPSVGAGTATLDRTLFAAKGNSEALATVSTFGRYSVAVKSDQGTAVQVIDRMAGPGPVDGSAGHSDGRVDGFLDRGQYKVRLFADPRGSGDAQLSITPSVELNAGEQQLVELKPIAADLADHEQRSYWLDITERRSVAIEATGRYLADLRLWKDGNWLVDAVPMAGVRDPVGGQPLAIRQLAVTLEPGLYRVTAYGGVGEKWSSGGNGKPFYLRYGIAKLPEAGRFVEEASPLGLDRWLVPKSASYFRIDIDHPEHAVLSVADYAADHPFSAGGTRAAVEKDSRDPKAEVRVYGQSATDYWLVTVERTPGAKYRLQYFDDRRERALDVPGESANYWLATLQAGSGVDALDPTAIVVADSKTVVAASTLHVDETTAWRRKFNLIQPVSLYLQADGPTELVVEGTGADAEYRIEPFLTDRPQDYRTPPTKMSGGAWRVDKGYWELTVMPRESGKGILDMTLRATKATAKPIEQPRLTAPVFPSVGVAHDSRYMLYLSATGENCGGAALHKLPLDLTNGATFQLAGGATVTISATMPAAGTLEARTEDGSAVPLAIDGRTAVAGPMVEVGAHSVALTAPGNQPVYVSLLFTPTTLLQATPLPPVDPARLAARPKFPELVPDKPAFLDLDRSETATFNVAVGKPALYRLESSGIIETSGALRTRTVTSLDGQAANGVGRNFLIQQYLREGDYQLSVSPSGRSHGAIGVAVSATPVADLGALEPELWARATLSPGQAGRYRFHIAVAGDYRLRTLGLHHDFTMRLDDGDGWPVLKPGTVADVTQRFEPGDYQMVLLPQAVEARAVTLLSRITQPAELSGHGPFALPLGDTGRNRWMEPEKGAARTPDRWTFSLPAPADLTLTINNGMSATLVQDGKATDKVALSNRVWTGTLPRGDYAVEVVSAEPNSRVDYSLTVSPTEMVVGQTRPVTAPATLPVSVGEDRQIEFASFGGEDVKARLLDQEGKLVAANDDRDNDWNFLIPLRLRPGRYQLQIDPVGARSLKTEVALIQAGEVKDAPLPFDKRATVADGQVHIVPIGDSPPGTLVAVTVQAATSVGLSIEGMNADQSWKTLGSTSGRDPYLALARGSNGKRELRLRVWSIDHAHIPIDFVLSSVTPANESESGLASRGVTLTPLEGAASSLAAASVTLDQPGVLQLTGGAGTMRWAVAADTAVTRDSSGAIVTPSSRIWLVDRVDGKRAPTIIARRIDPNGADPIHLVVRGGESISLPIPPAKDSGGIVLWRADGQGGQPGVALHEMGAVPARPPLMAVGVESPTLGSAVAVAPAALTKPVIKLWNAGSSDEEMPVTLSHTAFTAPKAMNAALGITDGSIGTREAQSLVLPAGMKRLTLVLPPDTVAIPMKGDAPEQVLWTMTARAEIVETAAERILLLHAATGASPYSLTVEPVDAKAPLALSAGAIISRYSPTPGLLHFRIDPAPSPDTLLHVAGSAEGATVVGPDGAVRRGKDVAVAPGSQVTVAYRLGLFAIGTDAPVARDISPAVAVTPPSAVALAGGHMNLTIPGGSPRLIHVASDTPVVLRTQSGADGAGRVLFGAGADLNFVVAQGQAANLSVEPAGVAALSGSAHFTAVNLTPIGEGLGSKRRLAPGQSRAFSFALPDTRTIGVGVRASVDIATCRLLAADGTEIGRGLVHMHELKAGSYVLVVDAPNDGPAIDIEPALVGSMTPDKGPPESVKADYLALVGKQVRK